MTNKVLIIDDDVDTLKLVGLMLERQGYEISVASNGTIGLAKAAEDKPELILLDVMMPDLDGYEVTKRLRSNPALAHIPIIMFTAKTMVDDKVAGFEAGVDDYLTKPTHPAELTAHVKAVLARSAQAVAAPEANAQIVGFLGSRSGIGTTTLALNSGVALLDKGYDVIIAEINPGHGSMGLELDIQDPSGLSNVLSRSLKDIHLRSVEAEIVNHSSGVRLLLSSFHPRETELEQAVPQIEAVVSNLASMCDLLILDLGAGLKPFTKPVLQQCDRIILIVEPVYPSDAMGRALLQELETSGINTSKVGLALINRVGTSLQVPWRQVESDLGIELAGIVSPAPEQAHQASQAGSPLVDSYADSLVSEQIRKLAESLLSYLHPPKG
ncbi:MAG: response regulator [Anaerolineales bacterium]|nr:MAG: response regulator [Anaerolineales bacterium]